MPGHWSLCLVTAGYLTVVGWLEEIGCILKIGDLFLGFLANSQIRTQAKELSQNNNSIKDLVHEFARISTNEEMIYILC